MPCLVRDFDARCAYSMMHLAQAGTMVHMEVDHHNPTLTGAKRHQYGNLFLASRHCNLRKGHWWPTREEAQRGERFLNPCAEMDYSVHIFEDPNTHELVAATPAGHWHIKALDLNHVNFVEKRKDRAAVLAALKPMQKPAVLNRQQSFAMAHQLLVQLFRVAETSIPPIPPPPRNLLSASPVRPSKRPARGAKD